MSRSPSVPPWSARVGRCLMALLPLALLLIVVAPTWAGPVSWIEVPPTTEGRQWWDAGSLRLNRSGHLTVLSRFQPPSDTAAEDSASDRPAEVAAGPTAAPAGAPASRVQGGGGQLYVMELDCDQELYRDISVNGLPRFNPPWQPTGREDLTAEVLRQACAAFRS